MMRPDVLIVGGQSPLGRALSGYMKAEGRTVCVTARNPAVGALRVDVNDPGSYEEVLRVDGSTIFLLAQPRPDELSEQTDVFLRASDRFLRWAEKGGARRIIYTSSAAVYGDHWRKPIAENDAARGSGQYAHVKRSIEDSLARMEHVDTVSARIFNIFGRGFSSSLINRLRSRTETPFLRLDANFIRDYVHVDDVCRALGALANIPRVSFPALNIGSGVGTSNLDLAGMVHSGAYVAAQPGAPSYSVADISLAASHLGYSPLVRLEAEISRVSSS